jgi:hypothetical protein
MLIPFKQPEYLYTPKKFRKGWRIVVTDTVRDTKFLFDSAWYTEEEAEQTAEYQRRNDDN